MKLKIGQLHPAGKIVGLFQEYFVFFVGMK